MLHAVGRIAIVNRGEAAARFIHAAREFDQEHDAGLCTIALHTRAEAGALFVREADEAVCLDDLLGDDAVATSPYLDLKVIERALTEAKADAVWPGWGFLAENADFAELCERLGIIFIGPSGAVMRRLGDKIAAKHLAEQADVPVAPWSGGPVDSIDAANAHADAIGYPLVVKATAGGGGRGIRLVMSAADLPSAFESARAEAGKAFGDPTVFMERRVSDARHVEVQVIGDHHGTVWAVGVRDCSLQRRNQKVIEESRSTALTAEQEDELRAASTRLCTLAGYTNAGTVEFLYQPSERSFAFLEVNTRLQVEHPVTEVTTGLDLVKLQIHVAHGGRLSGDPPPVFGHAIEARLNAEDPEREFAPAPGSIELLVLPTGPGVRVDTGVGEGDVISPEFDSMIAKIIAWGGTREEALARLQRALAGTVVVVRGGMTNKSFLLELLSQPDVIDGEADTGWLDRFTATGAHADRGDARAALAVAAIDAHEADETAELARFFASASRGRVQPSRDVGHVVELLHRGLTYRVAIAKGSPHGWYRIQVDGDRIDVVIERIGRLRSRLTMGGRTHRAVSFSHGTDQIVEIDGATFRFARDDGGLVRAPAAAVVVRVLVERDEVVAAGARLVVVESMKTEVAITAPVAGRISEVYVASNLQVEAGSPLVRLEPPESDAVGAGPGPSRVRLADVGAPAVADPRERAEQCLEALQSFIAGFDLAADEATQMLVWYERARAELATDDPELFHAELGIVATFADLCSLTRNRRDGDPESGDRSDSPREHFRTYLRSLDADREGLPESFRAGLLRALSYYGVRDLERTPELEQGLYRIFQAHQRGTSHLPVVLTLLERLAHDADELSEASRAELRETLDRLIIATQLRHPVVGNLARSIRYRCFDEPLIEQARSEVRAAASDHLARLAADPDAPDHEERLAALVNSPQRLIPLLTEGTDAAADALMLEILTRRYYKIRPLEYVRSVSAHGERLLTAEYVHDGRRVRVIAARASLADLEKVCLACDACAAELAPTDRLALDLYLSRQDAEESLDARSTDIAQRLSSLTFATAPERIAVAAFQPGRDATVEHLTFEPTADGFEENRLVRGLHPMIARRLHMWRLSNFALERLPSAPDVHLFDCVARENPADERLIALAEVRDLTPVRDAYGRVAELPGLEQVLSACLDGLRRARAEHPAGKSLTWNRVQLYVWPPVETPLEDLLAVVRSVAPMTEGVGLEQVVVHCRVPQPTSNELHEMVVRVGRQHGTGLTIRVEENPTEPMQPLDEYNQKVISSQRRGAVYPYELVASLRGEGGTFTEHDIDEAGALSPVARPPGRNTAGVVIGVVSTPTTRHPEGMKRVAILGDPTKALGSIAEPECRRLLAAIDLAQELGAPIEWFALSAGAKIAMNSGTENLDWVGRVLRRLIELTQAGGEVNVIVTGINVGAQPYWNAEATMLMHTRGILVMTPDSALVLTGKQALDYAGGVSAEDNLGLGGYERIMGPNGQAQYWAANMAAACEILFLHYEHAYRAPGERFPRRAATNDPTDRDIRTQPHLVDGIGFTTVGDIFSDQTNRERKNPFDMRTLMRAVIDHDHAPLERWAAMRDAETAIVFEAHLGGHPVMLVGIESRPLPRNGFLPADGPEQWSAGTLFPLSSKKVARSINAASGNRPLVILANLTGFDGSPESLSRLQLEYGAEIGKAVVNFDGPIVLCVVSRYHGGAFVVFSATLNDNMEVLAVEGSFASVIGGAAAAAVVFTGDVARRTQADPRVRDLEARIGVATDHDRPELRTQLAEVSAIVRLEKLGEVAAEFDALHSVERALEVGSVHRIIPAAELRAALIDGVGRGMGRTLASLGATDLST